MVFIFWELFGRNFRNIIILYIKFRSIASAGILTNIYEFLPYLLNGALQRECHRTSESNELTVINAGEMGTLSLCLQLLQLLPCSYVFPYTCELSKLAKLCTTRYISQEEYSFWYLHGSPSFFFFPRVFLKYYQWDLQLQYHFTIGLSLLGLYFLLALITTLHHTYLHTRLFPFSLLKCKHHRGRSFVCFVSESPVFITYLTDSKCSIRIC